MLFQNIHPFGRYLRFMTVSKGQKFPPFIPYDARLFLCIQGKGVISADGVDYEMERGSVIIINSSIPYHLLSTEKEVLYFAANFDYIFNNCDITVPVPPATPTLYNKDGLIDHTEFDDISEFNSVVYLKGMSHLEQKCTIAEREYSRRLIFNEGVISGLLSEILFECARLVKSDVIDSSDKVEKILDYIHTNFDKPITNKDVGNFFSFHPNYINELVSKNTGVSLHKYLLQVRIARAIDLIEESDKSISEIAETCGFQNLYYFSRYFKKTTGISPTNFRRK